MITMCTLNNKKIINCQYLFPLTSFLITELNITLMCPLLDPDSPNMLTYIRLDHNKLKGPMDYHTYTCFPRMRMIYYGEQQTAV